MMIFLALGSVVVTLVASWVLGIHVPALIGIAVTIDVASLTITQYTAPVGIRSEKPIVWSIRHASWHAGLFFVALGGIGYLADQL